MNTLTTNKASFNALNLFFHKLYNDLSNKITVFKINHFSEKTDFTYDLETMKKALNSPRRKITKADVESDEIFDKWLNDQAMDYELETTVIFKTKVKNFAISEKINIWRF